MLLWVLIGIVLIAVVWALISASSGKAPAKREVVFESPPMVVKEPSKVEFRRTDTWEEGAKTSVSKNFGKGESGSGGGPDSGKAKSFKYDDDIEWLKKAQAFEPRVTANLKLDVDEQEEISKT
ncbi:MAG: hypothetical protein NTY09_11985 [bacterium]|nr:hypothetical protein [bacterium]